MENVEFITILPVILTGIAFLGGLVALTTLLIKRRRN